MCALFDRPSDEDRSSAQPGETTALCQRQYEAAAEFAPAGNEDSDGDGV